MSFEEIKEELDINAEETCVQAFTRELSTIFSQYDLILADNMDLRDFIQQFWLSGFTTNMLDNQSKEVQDAFYDVANTFAKFSPMARCILNHYIYEEIDDSLISGACFIDKWADKTRTIYLITDCTHTMSDSCPENPPKLDIVQFLSVMLRSADKFIDVFLEIGPNCQIKREKAVSYLVNTIAHFQPCMSAESRDNTVCVANSRIHWADMRRELKYCGLYETIFRKILENNDDYAFRQLIKKQKEMLNLDKRSFIENGKKIINSNPVLMKELSKVYPAEYRDLIVDGSIALSYDQMQVYEFHMRDVIDHLYDNGIPAYYDLLDHKPNTEGSIYGFIVGAFLSNIVMDVYLASRIFKTYSVKKSCHPPLAKHCIVYAGSAHIYVLGDILRKMGMMLVERASPYNKLASCTNVDSLSLPLFRR
jgi:hypothetical protein